MPYMHLKQFWEELLGLIFGQKHLKWREKLFWLTKPIRRKDMLSDEFIERALNDWRRHRISLHEAVRAVAEAAVKDVVGGEVVGFMSATGSVASAHELEIGAVPASYFSVPLYTRPQASAAVPECEWFPDSDMDNMPDTWQGGCGAVWSFIDGGPVENEMKFCPHCGGRVHISASQPEVKS